MGKEDQKQVLAVRLAGYETFALNQYADLLEVTRSDGLRHALVEGMRRMMLTHPDWPMHPAWAGVGDDKWVMTQFQQWAAAITDKDPEKHFEKVTMDGVSAYRWRQSRPTPKLTEWPEQVARYHARRQKEGKK